MSPNVPIKCILCSFIFMVTTSVFSQEIIKINEDVIARSAPLKQLGDNELRLNIAMSIVSFPEINYERFLTDNMGLGLALAFALEGPEAVTLRYLFLPYYRLYFGEKKASGFYIEGNLAAAGQKGDRYYYSYDQPNKAFFNLGCGMAIGIKLLARNGFIGEVYLGGGRLFGETINNGYARCGVSVGKRF